MRDPGRENELAIMFEGDGKERGEADMFSMKKYHYV